MIDLAIEDMQLPNKVMQYLDDPDEYLGIPKKHASRGSTYNLLEAINKEYEASVGGALNLFVVIGADNLKDLPKWYRYKDLIKKYKFIVVTRPGYPVTDVPKGMDYYVLSLACEGSSTDARQALLKGKLYDALEHMTPNVMAYAVDNNLYRPKLVGGGPDLLPDGSNYDRYRYDKAANTVDIAIVRLNGKSLEVLMIKRKWNPCAGKWAIPGGFVDICKEESLDTAALRELEEETSVKGIPVKQLGTYGEPKRDPRDRVISTVYYAVIPQGGMSDQKLKALDDAEEYQWMPLSEDMPVDGIAFDHAIILKDLINKLKDDARYTPLPFSLLPKKFTWKQVADAYEALLGSPTLNIRRKLNSRYDIVASGGKVKGQHRPASLLSYIGEKNKL